MSLGLLWVFGLTWTWGVFWLAPQALPLATAFPLFLPSQSITQEASVCPQVCAVWGKGQSGLLGGRGGFY